MARDLAEDRGGAAPDALQRDSRDQALRAEHDALASRLAARPSAVALRKAAVAGFLALVSLGVSWGLLWDRYGKTPTEHALAHTELYRGGFLLTGVGAAALLVLSLATLFRWGRLAREEDHLFARLRELRRALGIDP